MYDPAAGNAMGDGYRKYGRRKKPEEAADLVHQFAREVEHSDKNKKILEQLLRKENLFSLERLLETL